MPTFVTRRGPFRIQIADLPTGEFTLRCFHADNPRPLIWSSVISSNWTSILRYALHSADHWLRSCDPATFATLTPLPKEWSRFTGADVDAIRSVFISK